METNLKDRLYYGDLISLRSHHKNYISAQADGTLKVSEKTGSKEKFQLQNPNDKDDRSAIHYGDQVGLSSHYSLYLVAEHDGRLLANRTRLGSLEKFRFINSAAPSAKGPILINDKIALKSTHQKYVVVEHSGICLANRSRIGSLERFQLLKHPDNSTEEEIHSLESSVKENKSAVTSKFKPEIPAGVNGRTVTILMYGKLDGSAKLGHVKQTGLKAWKEVNESNEVTSSFKETNRDDWSVYLYDASRKISLQLDLHRKVIIYSRDGGKPTDLYQIRSATSVVNGWLANQASISSLAGRPFGAYYQTGEKNWIEFGKNGEARSVLDETHRDDWSIYLHDPKRKHNIQIDLHRKRVIRKKQSNRKDLYIVTRTTAPRDRAYLTPPVNGQTANKLEFGSLKGKPKGGLKQTGPFSWVETNLKDKTRFYFTEIKRHNGNIVLFDSTRYVTLELQVASDKIVYSDAAARRFELYSILKVESKITGWVANRVRYRNFKGIPLGMFGQTGETTWVERNAKHQVTSRFNEVQRDDWSVYLHDPSRDVHIQIDLHTEKIYYKRGDSDKSDLYSLERASSDPYYVIPYSHLPVKSQNVKTVAFGTMRGKPSGQYHQTGFSTWVELGTNHQVKHVYEETSRDHDSVYLEDVSRNVSVQINLENHRIIRSKNNKKVKPLSVLRTSATLNGWAVSAFTFGNFSGKELGKYRQVSDSTWVERNIKGETSFHFNEIRREDWSVVLKDPSRNVTLEFDLRNQRILYSDDKKSNVVLYKILSEAIESNIWLNSENITSRSSLTQDFDPDPNAGSVNPLPVYRTSISFSKVTSYVDVWASKEVELHVNGKSYTVDNVRSARFELNQLFKLGISISAIDVHCPNLLLRTDLMMPDQRHYIFPDVEAHKKIVNLKDGDLHRSREQLGIPAEYSKEDLNHFQKALTNMAKTVQHTYNKTSHGVHHDRVLHPGNMQHPHFSVDFSNEGARYKALQPSEVPTLTAHATRLEEDIAQGLFSKIKDAFKKAEKVVVHTVENVGHDIVQTAENVGHDVVETVQKVGEDIVHGDVLHAGQDLFQGGENLGKDLVSGAGKVAKDTISGAGQLVVITLHVAEEIAEEAVQYVMTHTGFVGEALSMLFDKIGAALEKVVDWLLDKMGWTDILHTHNVLFDLFNNKLDEMKNYPEMFKKEADNYFVHLSDQIGTDIEAVINKLGHGIVGKQPAPVSSHSDAMEKIEWVLSKFVHYETGTESLSTKILSASQQGPYEEFLKLIKRQLGKNGNQILGAIEAAGIDLKGLFSSKDHSPDYLLGALLEIVKAVAISGLDAIAVIFDALLDLVVDVIEELKYAANAPIEIPFLSDLYKTLTHGNDMNLLSLTSLMVAIPATIIYKAEYNNAPFGSSMVGSALTEIGDAEKEKGIVYGVCHLFLALFEPINTAKSYKPKESGSSNDNVKFKIPAANVQIAFLLSVIAQSLGNPIPQGEKYKFPSIESMNDEVKAPNYWAHVIWGFQWAGLSFNMLLSMFSGKVSSNFTAGLNSYWGLVHMALMSVLDNADREKASKLLQKQKSDLTAEEENYLEWSEIKDTGRIPFGGSITRKGFSNIMDTFPEVAQAGAMPDMAEVTEGISIVAAAGMQVLGHMGEGITVIVRTVRNELL